MQFSITLVFLVTVCGSVYHKTNFVILNEPIIDNEAVKPLLRSLEERGVLQDRIFLLDEALRKYPTSGKWSLGYWLMELYRESEESVSWFFLGTAQTRIDLSLWDKLNDCEKKVLGYPLQDKMLMITHHYFKHENFTYPLLSSGVLLHRSVLKDMNASLGKNPWGRFIIVDPIHNFFKDLFERLEVRVENADDMFCLFEGSGCVSGTKKAFTEFTNRSESWSNELEKLAAELTIVVKTTEAHHSTRVRDIQRLWANGQSMQVGNGVAVELLFGSDKEDHTIPTMNLNVPNTTSGHCAKFHAILEFFYRQRAHKSLLLVVDDDTLLNLNALMQSLVFLKRNPQALTSQYEYYGQDGSLSVADFLLAREYAKTEGSVETAKGSETPLGISPLYLGERYGYGHWAGDHGYDYMTGGGGILFDRPALKLVFENDDAHYYSCNKPADADDMAVGRWFNHMKVGGVHLQSFHQATKYDYHEKQLETQLHSQPHISFHRLGKEFEESQKRFEFLISTISNKTHTNNNNNTTRDEL